MLGIYAETFKTATRTNCTQMHEVPPAKSEKRRRWWFSRPRTVCIDVSKL